MSKLRPASHVFSTVPRADIPRSSFDRSHGMKGTCNAGYLIPIFVDEALPADTFNLRANIFARLATPIKPVMDNLYLDTFFFAVPIRLIWDNWQKMCGEQIDPGDSTDYIIPQIVSPAGGFTANSLEDYFGLPTEVAGISVSSLWHRAYNLIYNEWFRDENLIDSVVVNRGDGPDVYSNYKLLRRGKRHDYFTSCLPWPQKGESVSLPLGSTAPVVSVSGLGAGNPNKIRSVTSDSLIGTSTNPFGITAQGSLASNNLSVGFYIDPNGRLAADLSDATAATINQLREAFQIQRLLERDARGGTRYTEILRSHFGVVSPDARLQRPEYLGGGSTPMNMIPIVQQSSTDATSPQGNLAGMGIINSHGHGFVKSFTEHCIIIGLMSIRADLNYQQGLNRMWSRRTRFDFYWPALAHIGEQAVLNQEIYCTGTATDDDVFGYQERFAEYRYKPSLITGELRSNYATPLDSWHLAQHFGSLPTLSKDFIEENPPISRVIAVPSQSHFIFDCWHQLKCARPMPLYSVPGLIDHL